MRSWTACWTAGCAALRWVWLAGVLVALSVGGCAHFDVGTRAAHSGAFLDELKVGQMVEVEVVRDGKRELLTAAMQKLD